MNNINNLINIFIKEATIYSKAIPNGDHKVANKANRKMETLYKKIKILNGDEKLKEHFNYNDDGVRLCIASTLIQVYPNEAINVLKDILKKDNVYSLLAEMGLDLWKQGKL